MTMRQSGSASAIDNGKTRQGVQHLQTAVLSYMRMKGMRG
jgi:hypothetical protein